MYVYIFNRRILPATADRNGTTNTNNMPINNGYSNRTLINHSTARTYARNHQSSQHPYQQQQQPAFQPPPPPPEMRRIDDNVIRLPRGPDGTSGFILKR